MIAKEVVQQHMLEWMKSQGTWAVLFIGMVMWAKPHADALITAHAELIRTLAKNQDGFMQNNQLIIKNQENIVRAIEELQKMVKESRLMRESIDEQTRQMRDNRSMVAIPSGD